MTVNVLCICDYGQTRSVGMKYYINGLQRENDRIDNLQYDVLAVGSVTSSKKTMKMLKQWADIVIDVRKYIPLDDFSSPFDDRLQNECAKIWEDILNNKRRYKR